MPELESLGWNDRLSTLYEPFAGDGVVPGRVSIQHRGAYDVLTELGELRCEVPRRLVHEAATNADLPVVGDWVVVAPGADAGSAIGTIAAVLPRWTKFSRKTAWQAAEEQVLASNIDVAFLVASMNEDLSLRRLERYLILAWESGARPVIVLTKAVVHPAPEAAVAPGRDDRRRRAGARDLEPHGRRARGRDRAARARGDGRSARLLGRRQVDARQHSRRRGAPRDPGDPGGRQGPPSTTRRELIQLPTGALIIDTPGIRELQLWVADDGIDEAFEDITALFNQCRFSDCAHDPEPGCAVRAALADGTLEVDRWDSYLKLQAELAHLERKLDKRAASEERKKWKAITAQGKANMRLKGR